MEDTVESGERQSGFSKEEREAVYRAIFERRDVRSQFLPTEIPDQVLGRILMAAHHAPSVGFMQPWEFVLVRSPEVRKQIFESFEQANAAAASIYADEQLRLYQSLRLQGILSSPLNVCVTCNREVQRGHGLGRQTMPETDLYSCVCAVQNLWLAARVEGVGVGWVSILSKQELRSILRIPDTVEPIAYLCVGYVSEFAAHPDLERAGWAQREQLQQLLYFDRYGTRDAERGQKLFPR